MNLHALQHRMSPWDAYSLARNQLTIRMRAARGDLRQCTILFWPRTDPKAIRSVEMAIVLRDSLFDYYEATLEFPSVAYYIKYCFLLSDQQGAETYFSSTSVQPQMPCDGFFEHLYTNEGDIIACPGWAQGIVYYQIFVDRFFRDSDYPARRELRPWGTKPDRESYLGGNLKGILRQLDYLDSLGVECLYLTPIFLADFNHKYATIDYRKVDPDFGTNEDLFALVDGCHRRGIRILLDGVFNHCGVDFPPFKDVLEKQESSAYTGWFYIKQYPVTISSACYECVGDYQFMPKLNTSNGEVRRFILDIMKHWLEAGIDGWRLDVADEVDYRVWEYAHAEIKESHPDALLLGETWGDGSKMLSGRQLDTVMNYLFRDAMLAFFAHDTLDAAGLSARLGSILSRYHGVTNQLLYNLLDSHDTARFLTECGGRKERLKLATAFQILYPGCPAIYYGDEVGLEGENDPDSRRSMPWAHQDQDEGLLAWYKKLIRIRKEQPAVRSGGFITVLCQNDVFAFARILTGDDIYAVFNRADSDFVARLPVKARGEYIELLTGERYQADAFVAPEEVCNEDLHHYSGTVEINLHPAQVLILKRL